MLLFLLNGRGRRFFRRRKRKALGFRERGGNHHGLGLGFDGMRHVQPGVNSGTQHNSGSAEHSAKQRMKPLLDGPLPCPSVNSHCTEREQVFDKFAQSVSIHV